MCQALLCPLAFGGVVTGAQVYYKATSTGRTRSLVLFGGVVVALGGSVAAGRLAYLSSIAGSDDLGSAMGALVSLCFCVTAVLCLGALWRRSVLASPPLPASAAGRGLGSGSKGRGRGDDDEDEDDEALAVGARESTSLLGGTPSLHQQPPGDSPSGDGGSEGGSGAAAALGALALPLAAALLSTLLPDFWSPDAADAVEGWGPTALVVAIPLGDLLGGARRLRLRYAAWGGVGALALALAAPLLLFR